jgi:ribosome-associated heat shock protein Hsp15
MTAEAGDHGRADLWFWHARLFKTRSMAAGFISTGRVRLIRTGLETRLDKPSRTLRPGDELVFALNGRVTAVRVTSFAERRGSASEARRLYELIAETNE